MNRQLSSSELALLERSFPVEVPVTRLPVTRREKLLRFAAVIRQTQHDIVIFHKLEYMYDAQLELISHPNSAFAQAAADPVLQDAGLAGSDALSAKKFFELSTEQLHEFSCDCGGHISNEEMARRIERLAA